jgi:hypothetical protein
MSRTSPQARRSTRRRSVSRTSQLVVTSLQRLRDHSCTRAQHRCDQAHRERADVLAGATAAWRMGARPRAPPPCSAARAHRSRQGVGAACSQSSVIRSALCRQVKPANGRRGFPESRRSPGRQPTGRSRFQTSAVAGCDQDAIHAILNDRLVQSPCHYPALAMLYSNSRSPTAQSSECRDHHRRRPLAAAGGRTVSAAPAMRNRAVG